MNVYITYESASEKSKIHVQFETQLCDHKRMRTGWEAEPQNPFPNYTKLHKFPFGVSNHLRLRFSQIFGTWASHCDDSYDNGVLGGDPVLSDKYVPTFQGKLADNKDGSRFHWNIRTYLSDSTASQVKNDHIYDHKTYLEITRFLSWFFQ